MIDVFGILHKIGFFFQNKNPEVTDMYDFVFNAY
jgi:hypothetical protein